MSKNIIILFPLLLWLLTACNEDIKQTEDSAFSLHLLQKDNTQALLLTNNLDSIDAFTAALPLTKSLNFNREYLVKDGFYYQLNYKNNYFRKFGFNMKGLVPLDSILLGNNYLESAIWINDSDTLLISTIDATQQDHGNLFVVDSKNLNLLDKKKLPIPPTKDGFNILNIGIMNFQDNKLWLAYSYSKYTDVDDYTTSENMYFMTDRKSVV